MTVAIYLCMKKYMAISIVFSFLFTGCSEKSAVTQSQVSKTADARNRFLVAFMDPNSDIYKNPEEKQAFLRDMAANRPAEYQSLLDSINNLRFSRGLRALNPNAMLNVRAAKKGRSAVEAPKADVGACVAAKVATKDYNPFDDNPDNDTCPDSCLCVAAYAVAYAYAAAGGVWAEGWGYGYAYAFVCAADPAGDACGGAAPDACADVGDGPMADISITVPTETTIPITIPGTAPTPTQTPGI